MKKKESIMRTFRIFFSHGRPWENIQNDFLTVVIIIHNELYVGCCCVSLLLNGTSVAICELLCYWKMLPAPDYCKFCFSNGEAPNQYRSHRLKNEWGNVTCPILRSHVCVLCSGTGDSAHTLR